MTYRICLIEGDGIGHEVVPAGRRLLEATGLPLTFVPAEAGWDVFQRTGLALPAETLEAVREADATLFGAVSSPLHAVEGYRSPIIELRRTLDLYANLRPAQSHPVPGSREGIDLLIVRENTEGLYVGRERREGDTAVAERIITRRGSERIARAAFRLAHMRRGHVTIVHKANVLRTTCGLFREAALAVAADFPDVHVEEMLVDVAAMRLITEPERFDVLVTTNLFGDILSDEAAALVGGLGLAPSGNIGEGRAAIFEPVHGSAPDIAGRGIANPLATFLAVAMLLDHLGEAEVAMRVRYAVGHTLRSRVVTPDLGGEATTHKVTEAVIAALG
ncbi:MAG: isocitrate/isopropylmalate dehydrogenase family protein [Chloroflexi bacterium]|nr:isocitrate/isopropylmalate dehydrogenase family protein [Chloroflexota bacterium]